MFSGCALSFLTSFPSYSDHYKHKIKIYTKIIYRAKKSFKIAQWFALALCRSIHWVNFALFAGWQLRKSVIVCLPSCHRYGGTRDNPNAITIFAGNGCPPRPPNWFFLFTSQQLLLLMCCTAWLCFCKSISQDSILCTTSYSWSKYSWCETWMVYKFGFTNMIRSVSCCISSLDSTEGCVVSKREWKLSMQEG
jgi:hypothetical protein